MGLVGGVQLVHGVSSNHRVATHSCQREPANNAQCPIYLPSSTHFLCFFSPPVDAEETEVESQVRPGEGFVGLRNLGATCYVNSLLQVPRVYHDTMK